MDVQEFEVARKKEPLTVVGTVGGAFAKWTRKGRASNWREQNTHSFYYSCQGPAQAGSLGVGIVYGPWYRTRVGRLL